MIACLCHAVTDAEIRAAAAAGRSVEEIARSTGAGTSCGCCAEYVAGIVREHQDCGSRAPCPGCPRRPAGPAPAAASGGAPMKEAA
jgi:bacterioferritin-associated ferredoxin